jgi:hypothetical protein
MNSEVPAAVAGACLSVVGMAAYLRDVRRGATVPHRGSWLVWTVVTLVGTAGQGAHGVSWTLLVLGTQAATNIAVLALAVRRGVGGVSVGNAALLGVAGTGIVAWMMAADPLAATAGAVLADGAGLVAIVPKVWVGPFSETTATYALAGATGLTAVASVTGPDHRLLLFPAYYCLANSAVALLIVWRRRTARGRTPRARRPGGTPPRRALVAHGSTQENRPAVAGCRTDSG